jgi:hypothetical protein
MVRSLRRRQRGCAIFDPADAIVYSANFLYAPASHLAQVLIILLVAIAVL